ncbi:MAG: DUF2802 domain-containing protein [Methylococcales bacterium]|nr:DUF2802 domain-containing protein [Methylococcales bacterium]
MILNSFLMTIFIAVISGVVIILVIALVWLVRTHLKLKRDYQSLADVVHGHNNDIADLCSAARAADGHIAAMDEQIGDLGAKVTDYQHNEPSTHPYGLVIQKVRGGATVSELMQNSGLSQDEAALLIRLHGSKERIK